MAGLLAPQFQDEDVAREHLEKLLWPDGPVCPHCGVIGESTRFEKQAGTKTHARTGTLKCNGCKKQFTVTVGTIFEDSHIPLNKWLLAIHLMCSSKKGISALQLQRNLDLGSYRTAWFMCHRVRWALTQEPMAEMLKGIVEVDETWVGGRQKGNGSGSHMRREISNKTPVLALVERGGDVRSFPVESVTLKNIKPILQKHIDPKSHLMTDEHSVYYFVKDAFPNHSSINHKEKEYVRREETIKVTTNTVESFFSLIKRGHYGIFHHWDAKYMGQYCAEFNFRYNVRKLSEDERFKVAVKSTDGKRLMLKMPKNVN